MTAWKKRLVGNTPVKLNFHPWGSFCKKQMIPGLQNHPNLLPSIHRTLGPFAGSRLEASFFGGDDKYQGRKKNYQSSYRFQPSETKQLEVHVWWNFLLTKLRCKICTSSWRKVIFVLPTNKRDTTQPHETFLSILVNHGGILWVILLYISIIYTFFS